jgi:hypothetical protein
MMRSLFFGLACVVGLSVSACDGDAGGGAASPDLSSDAGNDAAIPDAAAPDAAADVSGPDASDSAGGDADGGAGPADATAPDTGAGDAAEDTGNAPDTAAPDTGNPMDVAEPDAGPGGTIEAVPGERCSLGARIGLVTISAYEGGPLDASVVINDAPDVLQAEAVASDAACTFYEQLAPGFCDACPPDTLCDHTGTCKAYPSPVPATLRLVAGGESQTFEPQGGGQAWGPVTLPGRTFAVEVALGDLTIQLGETTVPEPLLALTGTLEGGSEAPTGLDITWTPQPDGGEVFTRIPINHHAAGPTATECSVPASAGALHVDGSMLLPLAVATGLEFQGMDHVRFAAAETPAGCVEIRMMVSHYPNLSY